MSTENDKKSPSGPRVWVDGCFDLWHYGHANALRQAKELGGVLVVGIHSDKEIAAAKGMPVMKEEERYKLLSAMKWVDEIVQDAPYKTTLEFLDSQRIDFAVHGDDISIDADGNDSFAAVKNAGRFRYIRRTRGVSTTDVVGRMLLMNKRSSEQTEEEKEKLEPLTTQEVQEYSSSPSGPPGTPSRQPVLSFVPSSRKIVQFSSGREPGLNDKVIYVDGAFDMLHVGHTEFFRKARELGDFLIVGVHSDHDVNRYMGSNFPIMNLHERLLAVLGCKYVDEVVIGAPYPLTSEILNNFGVSKVVTTQWDEMDHQGVDVYEIARKRDILEEVNNDFRYLSVHTMIERVIDNALQYRKKVKKTVQYADKKELEEWK